MRSFAECGLPLGVAILVRLRASRCGCLLRRILQRPAGRCSGEMLVGDLEVVAGRHLLAIAQPGGYDVDWKLLDELRLSG